MTRLLGKAIIGLVAQVIALTAAVESCRAGVPAASFATTGAKTSVPYGWLDFCNRYSGECDGPNLPPTDVDLTPRSFAEIERLNRQVNGAIEAVTDADHWNTVDRWDYPLDGRGDCEDFVLYKRKLLLEAGFPRQGLLVTVVKDLQGEGHAVLTVRTSRGDFVLDNLTDKVKPWSDTGYAFIKRQSQVNPNVWVTIGTPSADPLVTSRR